MGANLLNLFSDVYFWAGVGFFIFSLYGVFWILRALQNESEPAWIGTRLPPPDPAPAPFRGPDKTIETRAEPAGATLESLSLRLEKIEGALTELDRKISQAGPARMDETAEELKSLIQILKSNQSSLSAPQLNQLFAKVDRIHQVLASISGSEPK